MSKAVDHAQGFVKTPAGPPHCWPPGESEGNALMNKAVKWIAISSLILVVLILVALAVVPLMLPLESMIAEAIQKDTGRPVKVESVSLSLLGGAEFEIKGLEVGELQPYGDKPLVKLNRAYAQFSLLPLLDSTLALGRVEVDGLEISVVSSKQGKLNIEDMPAATQYRTSGSDQSPASKPPTPEEIHAAKEDRPHFIIGRFEMNGSKVLLTNLATGHTAQWPITQAYMSSDIQGKTADVDIKLAAPGLAFSARTAQAATNEPARINAKIDLAEIGKLAAVVLPGLKCRGDIKLDLSVRGSEANPEVKALCTAEKLYFHAPWTGLAPFDLQELTMDMLAVGDNKAQTIDLRNLRIRSFPAGYDLRANGTMSPGKTRGKVLQMVNMDRMASALSPLLPKGLKLSGTINSDLDIIGDGNSITFSGETKGYKLAIQLPGAPHAYTDNTPSIKYNVKMDGQGNLLIDELALFSNAAKLFIKGTASTGKPFKAKLVARGPELHLDQMLALIPASGQGAPAGSSGEAKPAPAEPDKGHKPPTAALHRLLDDIDMSMDIKIDKIIHSGLEFERFEALAKASQGKLELQKLSSGLFGGSMGGTASLDANKPEPVISASAKVSDMTITPERFTRLQEATHIFSLPLRIVNGVFFVDAQIQAKGLTLEQLKRTAEGKGEMKVLNGVKVAFDCLDRMEGVQLFAPLVRDNIPDFYSRLNGSYTIGGGELHYNLDFLESKEKVNVKIKGLTMLADGRVDARLMLSGEGIGRDLKRFLEPDGTLPVQIKGTFTKPVAVINISDNLIKGIKGIFGD